MCVPLPSSTDLRGNRMRISLSAFVLDDSSKLLACGSAAVRQCGSLNKIGSSQYEATYITVFFEES